MYVALSWVTSIDNLFLIGKYNRNVFKVNQSAVAECNKLPENKFDTINADFVDCNSLTVSLLNTRSLKKHAVDISSSQETIFFAWQKVKLQMILMRQKSKSS